MTESALGLLAAVAVRTAIVFVFLAVGLRITGRRQAGELNLHDLLLVLMAANAVQNAMTRGDGRLTVALVSSGTLILVGWLFAVVRSRHPAWGKWLVGTPTVLVEDGRLLRQNMRREGLGRENVMAAIRDQGLTDVSQVQLVVLESDGSLSVIARQQQSGG